MTAVEVNVQHNHAEGTFPATGANTSLVMRHRMQRATAAALFRWAPLPQAAHAAGDLHRGRHTIKVRDRNWHLVGCGQVQVICLRYAAEHFLALRFSSVMTSRALELEHDLRSFSSDRPMR